MRYFASCQKCGAFFSNEAEYKYHVRTCSGKRQDGPIKAVSVAKEGNTPPVSPKSADTGTQGSEPPQVSGTPETPNDVNQPEAGAEQKPLTAAEKRKATMAAKKAAMEAAAKEGDDE